MHYLLDLGFWLVPPGMGDLQQGDNPPIAVVDTLSVPRTAGPTTVQVLANDIDPEGQPLTLVSAYAALGTAVANPDNTVTYTPPQGIPAGQVEFDTVVYEIADVLDQRDTGQINVTIEGPDLRVQALADNTIAVTADSLPLDITVTEPQKFAATYSVDAADLALGPVALAVPTISGPVAVGQQLAAIGGLWIHDVAAAPAAQTWQWRRNGVDIPGATSDRYTLAAEDSSQDIAVVETLSDTGGSRSAPSMAVVAGFTPPGDAALIGWWDASDGTTWTESGGRL